MRWPVSLTTAPGFIRPESRRVRNLLLVLAALSAGGALAGGARADVPPGTYSWDQAKAMGVPGVEDFVKPDPSMPNCPPPDPNYPGETSDPDPDAPVCYQPPEAQGLVFVVTTATEPGSAIEDDPFAGPYRHTGSKTTNAVFGGGQNRAEISDPSVCYPCQRDLRQHFYDRIAAISQGNNAIEVGWVESNHPPITGNARVVLTVLQPDGGQQNRLLHYGFNLPNGGERAFRATHCGTPGALVVCLQIYENNTWQILRPWYNVMRCINSDGTGNCRINWFGEPFSSDALTWFNINGGADGLRMHNIRVYYPPNGWDIFTSTRYSGSWVEDSPYSLCRVFSWYHYTLFRGPPSC
jgi:hypothetical protein